MSNQNPTPNRAVKKTWIIEEDQALLRLIETYGLQQWSTVSSLMQSRTGKQCRERYYNHLQPNIKKGGWTEEEDKIIVDMQASIGNQWSAMTKHLPGRTDNAIKNRWHAINKNLPNHNINMNNNPNNIDLNGSISDPNSDTEKLYYNQENKIMKKKSVTFRKDNDNFNAFSNGQQFNGQFNNNNSLMHDPFFGPEVFDSTSPFDSDDEQDLPVHTPLSYDMLDCLIEEYEDEVKKKTDKNELVIKTEDVELTDDEWSSIKFDLSLDEVDFAQNAPKSENIAVYQSNSIAHVPAISPKYKKNLTVLLPDDEENDNYDEMNDTANKDSTFMPRSTRATPRSPGDFIKKFRV